MMTRMNSLILITILGMFYFHVSFTDTCLFRQDNLFICVNDREHPTQTRVQAKIKLARSNKKPELESRAFIFGHARVHDDLVHFATQPD